LVQRQKPIKATPGQGPAAPCDMMQCPSKQHVLCAPIHDSLWLQTAVKLWTKQRTEPVRWLLPPPPPPAAHTETQPHTHVCFRPQPTAVQSNKQTLSCGFDHDTPTLPRTHTSPTHMWQVVGVAVRCEGLHALTIHTQLRVLTAAAAAAAVFAGAQAPVTAAALHKDTLRKPQVNAVPATCVTWLPAKRLQVTMHCLSDGYAVNRLSGPTTSKKPQGTWQPPRDVHTPS
jgi:hypothetical protein